jgi:hypothetical protein
VRMGVTSRRRFLKVAGAAGAGLFSSGTSLRLAATLAPRETHTGYTDYGESSAAFRARPKTHSEIGLKIIAAVASYRASVTC